jgi:N-acetylmuramoyl-L-alanine amidase
MSLLLFAVGSVIPMGTTIGATSAAVPSSRGRTISPKPMHRPKPLVGKTIGIDPGHNGNNYKHLRFINHRIWNGREHEACDTTGTETNGGYTESHFNFRVARFLRADLRREGARVVMARTDNHGFGPCVNTRARIINRAHADVGIDIHADGAAASGRGFAILEPVKDKANRHVVTASGRFGSLVRHTVLHRTAMPTSTYDGHAGITHRDDLAGLNLTKVPLVLIECGNMRNSTDARLLTSSSFQNHLAKALAVALTDYALKRKL